MDPKQWETGMPYPPLGTIYAAGFLRNNGFEVDLFDVGLKERPNEITEIIEEKKPRYLVLYDDGFNYLTKMCLTKMREAAFEMISIGKSKGCTVVVSSSDSTDHYSQYLDHLLQSSDSMNILLDFSCTKYSYFPLGSIY